jgi:regulatory protein
MTAFQHALRFLKRRLLTERELTDRLAARAYSPADIEAAIGRLRDKGFLNDARLAEDRAATLVTRRHGRHSATRKLDAAGVDDDVVRRVVEKTFEPIDELAMAREILRKKSRSMAGLDDPTRYRRAFGVLLRKGYDEELIRTAIRDELDIDTDT